MKSTDFECFCREMNAFLNRGKNSEDVKLYFQKVVMDTKKCLFFTVWALKILLIYINKISQ